MILFPPGIWNAGSVKTFIPVVRSITKVPQQNGSIIWWVDPMMAPAVPQTVPVEAEESEAGKQSFRKEPAGTVFTGCSGRVFQHKKTAVPLQNSGNHHPFYQKRLSSLYFTGFQAGSTNVHFLNPTVGGFNANRFNVGFPHFIGSSMRMTHFDSEMSTLITNSTSSHDCTSLSKFRLPS